MNTCHHERVERFGAEKGVIHWCTICGAIRIVLGHEDPNDIEWRTPRLQ